MDQIKKVVVIGCSGAGALAARMLKKLNPSLDVTIIREQEEKGLLTRCATPYVATGNVTVDASYKDDKIFIGNDIELSANDPEVLPDDEVYVEHKYLWESSLENVGYDPEIWQGYAFGLGIERITMLKYKIKDIRILYQNDTRFLGQF